MLEDVEGSTPPVRDVATVEMFWDINHQRVLAVGENPRITDLDPEIRHPAGGRAGHDPLQVPRDPEVRLVVQSAGVHVLDVDLLSTCSELLQDGSLDEQTGGEHEKKSHPMIRYSENYGSERQVATEERQATSPGNTSVISREISDQKWHRVTSQEIAVAVLLFESADSSFDLFKPHTRPASHFSRKEEHQHQKHASDDDLRVGQIWKHTRSSIVLQGYASRRDGKEHCQTKRQ